MVKLCRSMRVYFDHNATTPVDPVVIDACLELVREPGFVLPQ